MHILIRLTKSFCPKYQNSYSIEVNIECVKVPYYAANLASMSLCVETTEAAESFIGFVLSTKPTTD